MAHKHLGKDFLPADVVAKVTGEAKYAEDFRAEGMVFARLLNSPYPHARVRSIDAKEALAMPGVVGILTPDEVNNPPWPDPQLLCSEPGYVGAPVLLLAAETETQAQDALEKIRIDWEVLPFHVDALQSLHPDRPDARAESNIGSKMIKEQQIKWTREDFDAAGTERMPMGRPAAEWAYGDLEANFAKAKLVGTFSCRGKVSMKALEVLMQSPEHEAWADMAASAATHPDTSDLEDARAFARWIATLGTQGHYRGL